MKWLGSLEKEDERVLGTDPDYRRSFGRIRQGLSLKEADVRRDLCVYVAYLWNRLLSLLPEQPESCGNRLC